mgnify:CR=1 FL=1
MIPLISIYGGMFHLLNHRYTLIFMHLGFSVSMAVFMYHGFIKESVPLALEEAAHIDGAGPFRTYFSIVFPLLKAPTATLVILYVLSLWNDYLLPSLILTDKKVYTPYVDVAVPGYLFKSDGSASGRPCDVDYSDYYLICRAAEVYYCRCCCR